MATLDEFQFVDAIRRIANVRVRGSRSLLIGVGDDAAVFRADGPVVQTTDTCVEGVHFKRTWLSPGGLGRRAFRSAVSDLSAMGADPRWVLLSLCLPQDWFSMSGVALVRGLVRDAATVGAVLVGGNISAAKELSIAVTVSGVASGQILTRDSAKVGDSVFVTGAPGTARAGLRGLLAGQTRGLAIQAWRTPPLRTHLGMRLAKLQGVGAVIDVSDGLAQDLGHIARASKVRVVVDRDSLPVPTLVSRVTKNDGLARQMVLQGGEDYELALTMRPRREAALQRLCKRLGIPVSRIGRVTEGRAAVMDEDGSDLTAAASGYDHARRGS